jgi:hypothetical protein
MDNEPEVFNITGAQTGMSKDQKSRQRVYLFSMGLRTACFVGGFFASGVLRWILIVGAVGLPYFAVVIANAGRERGGWRGEQPFTPPVRDALTAESRTSD